MEIRKLTTLEEKVQAQKISTLAFVFPADMEKEAERLRQLPESSEEYQVERWGAFLPDGQMTAGLMNYHYTVTFDGHEVLCGGVGNVSSRPENRRKGAVRGIFEAKLQDMRENGFVFSYLYPFSHRYYRKFGYELCEQSLRQWAKCEDLAHLPCQLSITMQEKDEGLSDMQALSHTFMKRYNLAVLRRENQWTFLMGDPYQKRQLRYLFRDDKGTLQAYVCFEPKEENGVRRADIRDMAYSGKEALLAIFSFMSRLSAQYEEVGGCLPPDIDLRLLVTEPYRVRQERSCGGMGRIVNVETALSLMKAPFHPDHAILQVTDDFLPENSGCYRLDFEKGQVKAVTRTDEEPDLCCTIQDLTRLVLGVDSPERLFLSPTLTVKKNREQLLRLFPQKMLHMNQPF